MRGACIIFTGIEVAVVSVATLQLKGAADDAPDRKVISGTSEPLKVVLLPT